MAHKVVKYRLTAEGKIPTFLKFGVPQGTSGMYAVHDSSTPSPRDWIMIGISEDGADISNAIEEITSKDNLITYLTSISSSIDLGLDGNGNQITFVPATAATQIWDDLNTLNTSSSDNADSGGD